MDELLDEGFALGRGATLEDVVDVIGQRVEFVARGHRGCLIEQSDQFVAAGLQLFRLEEITRTGTAIDRYLTAFENSTLDPALLQDRLTALRAVG